MSLPKERKFVECFKSNRDGSCNYCKTRSWRKGNKIYGMKDVETQKWIVCSDRKCYLEQGGTLTIFKPQEVDKCKNAFDIRIESCAKGFQLVYEVDELPFDKAITQGILLSVIENFNHANPNYSIEAKKK